MSASEDDDHVTDQSVIADDLIHLSQFHVTDKSATSDDLIPISQLLTKKPTPRNNLITPHLQHAIAPENHPSPLKICSPSPHAKYDNGFEDTDEEMKIKAMQFQVYLKLYKPNWMELP